MEHVTLSVPSAADFRGVVRLVVGGLGSRCGLSFEQVDDLQIAVEAVLNSQPMSAEELELDASIDDHLRVRLGPFDEGAGGSSSERMLRVLVPDVRIVALGGRAWVELAVPLAEGNGRP
jgi:hypothetical protein